MVSPIPDIYDDCNNNHLQSHKAAVERVLAKFFHCLSEDDLGTKKDMFWNEWRKFRSKRDEYAKSYIWNSIHLRNGDSHFWHQQFSCHTNVLGFVACQVCSKILGIGNAERQWGAVKKLKAGQRAKLGANKLKKQSTLYASACIQRGRLRQKVCFLLFCPFSFLFSS